MLLDDYSLSPELLPYPTNCNIMDSALLWVAETRMAIRQNDPKYLVLLAMGLVSPIAFRHELFQK